MQRHRLRILVLEGSQRPPTFIRNLIIGLLEQGVEVCLLGSDVPERFDSSSSLFTRIITRYRRLNGLRILMSYLALFLFSNRSWRAASVFTPYGGDIRFWLKHRRIHALIFKYDPDVIHFQWAAHIEFFDKLIRAKHFKSVVSLRGRHINIMPRVNPVYAKVYSDLFPYISRFHAVSKSIAVSALQYGATSGRIEVVYSYVPKIFIEAFQMASSKKTGVFEILSIGRFHWKKGYTDAILAMRKLKDRNIRFSYTIVSDGPVPDELLYLIKQLELIAEVRFVAGLPHQGVPFLMKHYSALILPSLEEGIANVVLEAMALGLPVISTDCGGMAEVIKHQVNGWIVPVRNPAAMALTLENVSSLGEEAITKIREQAHKTITQSFVKEISIPQFIELYKSLTKSRTEA